jgi:hypothetical protein
MASSSKFKPYIRASEVAALLNLNKWKSSNQVLIENILPKHPKWGPFIRELKKANRLETAEEKMQRLLVEKEDLLAAVEVAVQNSVAAKTESELNAVIEAAVADSSAILGERDASELQGAIRGKIQTQRGIKMEATAIREYDARHQVAETTVTITKTYIETDDYGIVGVIDHYDGTRVVEIKNRKTYWRTPPEYDLIQLLVYMKMYGGCNGVLVEKFSDRAPRETELIWDERRWEELHTKIVAECRKIETLTEEQVTKMLLGVVMFGR